LKAFRAMTFSAADHLKSWIAVPAPKGARLGTLVIFRSSNAAFYLRSSRQKKRVSMMTPDLQPICATYRKPDFSGTTQDGFWIAGHAACPKNVVIEAR
jgi:hypothetical protein